MSDSLLMISFADGFSGAKTIAEPILTAAGLRGLDFFPAGSAGLNPLAIEAGFQVVSVGLAMGGMIPAGYDVEFQSCGCNVPIGTVASRIAGLPDGKIGILSFHNVRPAVFKENDADPARIQAVVDVALASGLTICTFSDLLDT